MLCKSKSKTRLKLSFTVLTHNFSRQIFLGATKILDYLLFEQSFRTNEFCNNFQR